MEDFLESLVYVYIHTATHTRTTYECTFPKLHHIEKQTNPNPNPNPKHIDTWTQSDQNQLGSTCIALRK